MFHINSCSLYKNFEEKYLLQANNKTFDVTGISKLRIIKDSNLPKNINIFNYFTEFTKTESLADGTLL